MNAIKQIKNRLGDARPQARKIFAAAIIAVLALTGSLIRAEGNTDDVAPQVAIGNLDISFGGGGKVMTAIGQYSGAVDLCVQPDGKIVTAGYAQMQGHDDFALARYNEDGSLDTGFGTSGMVTTDFFGNTDDALSVILQPDGKIVMAGYAHKNSNDNSSSDFALARYNADGNLDSTFGAAGKVTTDFFGHFDRLYSIAIQPDGKLVAAGYAYHGPDFSTRDAILARYKADGTLDQNFGSGGKVATDFIGSSDGFSAVVIRPNGKIIAAGTAYGSSGAQAAFAQYNSDGSLDSSFGSGGKATLNVLKSSIDRVALQSDGKLVGVGNAYPGTTSSDILLARLKLDGSLDTSFGNDGIVLTDFFGQQDYGNGIVVQPDAKIVISARIYHTSQNSSEDFGLVRYQADGSLDNSFGFAGKVTTDFSGDDDGAAGIALQANGHIVVAGYAVSSQDEFALARYIGDSPALPPAVRLPIIQSVTTQGKQLIVTGLNFDAGAAILVDGQKQKKTVNDEASPETRLVAMKAAKFIAHGQTVTIQVKNLDGRLSNPFTFTRP